MNMPKTKGKKITVGQELSELVKTERYITVQTIWLTFLGLYKLFIQSYSLLKSCKKKKIFQAGF